MSKAPTFALKHQLKRPKPPKDIEEWLKTQEGLTREERAQWPLECSARVTLLDEPLQDQSPSLYQVDDDVFISLEGIKDDLQKHAPWDSSCLDTVAKRLDEVDEKICWYANRFISDGHPLATDRDQFQSVAGGLTNITNKAFMTELCDMDLINSRQLATGFRRNTTPSIKNNEGKDKRNVEAICLPDVSINEGLCLPAKLEPLPILDLVTKVQIPFNMSKPWKKVFFTDASTSMLINSFWWVWMDYFNPDKSVQATLFETICEHFVALLNSIEDVQDGQRDYVFMQYPECLCQAVYSVFCQACPGSNKVVNSESFLDYLTSLMSEWVTGIKVGPGTWREWPRYLLDPYHTTGHSSDRSSANARATNRALTESDVMALSTTADALALQRSQNSRVQFRRSKSGKTSCAAGYRRLLSGNVPESSQQGSPTRSIRGVSGKQERNSLPQESELSLTHVGPGPIFECVRFGTLGRSPLLHHFMVRHGLVDLDAPFGPTISRRQVKNVPGPSVGFRDLLKRSEEMSERKYDQYQSDIAKSVQDSFNFQRQHNAEMRKLEKQNRRILSHRNEVAILAEQLLSRKKSKQCTKAGTPSQSDR